MSVDILVSHLGMGVHICSLISWGNYAVGSAWTKMFETSWNNTVRPNLKFGWRIKIAMVFLKARGGFQYYFFQSQGYRTLHLAHLKEKNSVNQSTPSSNQLANIWQERLRGQTLFSKRKRETPEFHSWPWMLWAEQWEEWPPPLGSAQRSFQLVSLCIGKNPGQEDDSRAQLWLDYNW